MAIREKFHYESMQYKPTELNEFGLPWAVDESRASISDCPQIFREDGEPWIEANTYALNRLEYGIDIETANSFMNHLRDYAEFLERNGLDWRYFPQKRSKRCLVQYRGDLINRRDAGTISPSTISARMSAVIAFYRWADKANLIDKVDVFEDKIVNLNGYNHLGFKRTIEVLSSDLSIPNRKRPGEMLEGGLMPMNESSRKILLLFMKKREMTELYLMFAIGFFTGARIETIRTLRLDTLDTAYNDPHIDNLKYLTIGPPTRVKTKFNVSGKILIPDSLLLLLKKYALSTRRLIRQSRAQEEHKHLLFITVRGNKYTEGSFTRVMSELRKKLISEGLFEFKYLKFHQSRATFGTQLMRQCLISQMNNDDAIAFVKNAMLHKSESVTWKYIYFIENEKVKERLSDEFFGFFSGFENDLCNVIDEA